jgi:hypothetical protein
MKKTGIVLPTPVFPTVLFFVFVDFRLGSPPRGGFVLGLPASFPVCFDVIAKLFFGFHA